MRYGFQPKHHIILFVCVEYPRTHQRKATTPLSSVVVTLPSFFHKIMPPGVRPQVLNSAFQEAANQARQKLPELTSNQKVRSISFN
jgi:hypothetical protein